MRHGITALCVALLAAMTTTALAVPGERAEREDRQTIDASGKSGLTVRNPSGRTVIVGKADADAVSVVITKSARGRDKAEAEEMLDRIEVEIGGRGGNVVIETRDEKRSHRGLWSLIRGDRRSSRVDYTIEVPYRFNVNAASASGEIRLSNIGGDAEATVASGDVSVRAVAGDAEVRVTSGDVEVVDVGGDLTATGSSGSISVDNVKGSLKLTGTSGDFRAARIGGDVDARLSSGDFVLDGASGNVTFRAASGDAFISEVTGSVTASTSSGDLEVMIIPVKGREFSLSSSSGDISIYYVAVPEFGFQLDVHTASGSIEGDLPIKVSRVDRRRLQGVVATGAARVDIETASGDIVIVEREESALKPNR